MLSSDRSTRSDVLSTREGAASADDDDAQRDAAEIRYSLTALGEAALAEGAGNRRRPRFRGFGPCGAVG